VKFVNFLLPAHISGLSIGLLIYPGDQLWPCVLVSTIAICSKQILQVPVNGTMRHFMNPSNLAVAFLLTFYTWVGPAPMYQFTEYAGGPFKWVIPGILLVFGTLINVRLTGRGPLVAAWLAGFLLQDAIRHVLVPSENALLTPVAMMTGTAFVLFTNFMITDPGSTPSRPRSQLVFGFTAAMVYGALVLSHIVYGLFYCVVITCAIRGAVLWYAAWRKSSSQRPALRQSPSTALVPAIVDGETGVGRT
jgi:Na+-transporting NADH:ubiquinone oxidoreductase subunit NqrB